MIPKILSMVEATFYNSLKVALSLAFILLTIFFPKIVQIFFYFFLKNKEYH